MKDYKSISEKQKKLIEVLIKLVRLWHGMGMSEEQEERMWNIYNTMSPEMQKINSIIAELEQQEKCYPEKQIEEWKCEKCKKKKAIYHVCGECLTKIFEFKRK